MEQNVAIGWETVSIADAFAHWAQATTLDKESSRLYRRVARTLARHGVHVLGDLSRRNICRFQDERLALGRSTSTINNDSKSIVALCRWLERRGEFPITVLASFGRLRLPERRKGPPTYFTQEEFRDVLRPAAYAIAEWFGFAFEIACWTGVRRTELRHQHWEDYDLQGKVLRLTRRTKNRKVRVVSLCDEALNVVRVHMNAPGGPIFPPLTRRARTPYISEDSFKDAIAELEERTKIRCTWHKCRRTFTTWAICARIPPPDVARMLGHHDMSVLYRHYYCWLEQYNPAIQSLKLEPAA